MIKHRSVTAITGKASNGYGEKTHKKAIWEHNGRYLAKGISTYNPIYVKNVEYAEVEVVTVGYKESWHVK